MSRKTPRRQIEQAHIIAHQAYGLFEQAADDLEMSARLHREAYDELQVQIDDLTNLQADAQKSGMRADKNAKRIREFFE